MCSPKSRVTSVFASAVGAAVPQRARRGRSLLGRELDHVGPEAIAIPQQNRRPSKCGTAATCGHLICRGTFQFAGRRHRDQNPQGRQGDVHYGQRRGPAALWMPSTPYRATVTRRGFGCGEPSTLRIMRWPTTGLQYGGLQGAARIGHPLRLVIVYPGATVLCAIRSGCHMCKTLPGQGDSSESVVAALTSDSRSRREAFRRLRGSMSRAPSSSSLCRISSTTASNRA